MTWHVRAWGVKIGVPRIICSLQWEIKGLINHTLLIKDLKIYGQSLEQVKKPCRVPQAFTFL